MWLFQADRLSKTFHRGTSRAVSAVEQIDWQCERGQFVVLSGPSGAGKSTLLALLGLLDRPTSGRLLFDGCDTAPASDVQRTRRRRRMGFVFQDYGLLAGLSGWENVFLSLVPRGVPRGERRRTAGGWLERFGVLPLAERCVEEWSGGERQRLSLARALAGRPEVLLADEPTSNLDAATAAVVLEAFREYHEQGGTLIAAGHDAELIKAATLVMRMRGGVCEGIASRT